MTTDRRTSVHGRNLARRESKITFAGCRRFNASTSRKKLTHLKHSEQAFYTLLVVNALWCIFGERTNPLLLSDTDAQLIWDSHLIRMSSQF